MQRNNRPGHIARFENPPSQQEITEKRPRVAHPTTPIPRRASALPPGAARVRPRYPRAYPAPVDGDITRIPTVPQTTLWQYESADYEAESSLPSLSLVVSETPGRSTDRLELNGDIDMQETSPVLPAVAVPAPLRSDAAEARMRDAIADIDTAQLEAVSIMDSTHARPGDIEDDLTSWTAGRGANSAYARRIISPERSTPARPLWLRPIDNARWWFLYPGRMEFLLWLVGTILLMGATLILLLTGVLSLGMLNAEHQYAAPAVVPTSSAVAAACSGATNQQGKHTCVPAPGSQSPALHVTVLNGGPQVMGAYLQLHGQGFSPYGLVKFTHDSGLPCYPATTQADGRGEFFIFLVSGYGPGWQAGRHHIIAYDEATRRSFSLEITLVATSSE